jgi:hypothetical protein
MRFNKIIRILGRTVEGSGGHDNGDEQNTPDIRKGDRTVMLSEAKHLATQRDRPFAALRVIVEGR